LAAERSVPGGLVVDRGSGTYFPCLEFKLDIEIWNNECRLSVHREVACNASDGTWVASLLVFLPSSATAIEKMAWGARSYTLLGARTKSLLISNPRRRPSILLGIIICSILTPSLLTGLALHLFTGSTSSSFALSTINDQVYKGTPHHNLVTKIPNPVHYIWILKDPTIFSVGFKFFITAYSSHLYFNPDKI
jgi:hypothetical protein